ncbi:DUF2905 domain-containing protein [Lederbergia citrea]|uniref:DUF2905 domain-containing protein n=1 Tax=Lederbergia citrea TaxID=2833581 RepID=A0A942Z562_9BACI|nr:DUF2905 domain-containing protein [Lederbergia citrea]MBS4176216.1 DUF2905 domain-containing protein [Lederbergia citrea]MBS4202776.1 DUF2905 domain-containing protein [Lederbergia citrea]MBS4222556.1 DUF2905 domain-containing protein [Lederbergia citrea]
MSGISKLLMIVGGAIFLVGFLFQFVKLGKLPGDIIVKKGNTTFFFPVMTSIIISIILTAVLYVVGRFK